jgi:DNA-binding transcriptional LysR family regulator
MTSSGIGELNLTQLRLVDALQRSGSLTEAGAEVGLTQSAASHALARLRQNVQDPVFVRTSEGMQPTPYGTRLAASARTALQALDSGLQQQADFNPRSSKRAFNVIMSDIGQVLYLPQLLARLSMDARDTTLRVRPLPSKGAHHALESGEVDLAIGTFTALVSGCMQKRVYRERYVCVVRRDHPAFENGMTPQAFRRAPHAVADASGYVHEVLDRWLAKQKMRRQVKLRVPHFLVLPLVIANSDLLAIVSNRVANKFAEQVPLKIMPLPTKVPTYDIKLFWHARYHRDPANRWLRALFVDLFGD